MIYISSASVKNSKIRDSVIELAENGYIVADVIADMWKREEAKLRNDNDAKWTNCSINIFESSLLTFLISRIFLSAVSLASTQLFNNMG